MDRTINPVSPSLSVLMPVYNGQRYLREAIESILQQSWKDFEFIILNDGSSDDSEQIILSFSDPRIRYIRNESNLGLVATLNKGLDLASGKYIARMDADDVSLPERFAAQFRFMETHADIGVCAVYYDFIENGRVKASQPWFGTEEVNALLLFNSCLCHPAVMIRRSLLEEQNIRYDALYKHAEDYHLWAVLAKDTRFGIIEQKLFHYRNHAGQVTSIHNEEQKRIGNMIRKQFLDTMGFVYTSEELRLHSLVGMNTRIREMKDLKGIEAWFQVLAAQNREKKIIPEKAFNRVIGKLWLDTCGNTSLGLAAASVYRRSPLLQTSEYRLSFSDQLKLLLKCLIR